MKTKDIMQQVLTYKNKLFRYSLRIVGNVAEAEDVVQEVFIKIWQSKQDLSQLQNLEAWCMKLTKNLSIDKLRSKHQRLVGIPEGFDIRGNTATPHQVTESNDTMKQITDLIDDLPERQKHIIELRDVNGQSYQEIADIMEISLDQVRVTLFRARKNLKAKLLKSKLYGPE